MSDKFLSKENAERLKTILDTVYVRQDSGANGTITGITMNGESKGDTGVVDLGTVITEHQTLKTINNNEITGSGNVVIAGGYNIVKLTQTEYNNLTTKDASTIYLISG